MKTGRPRVIITSDLEVDDMNSFIHLALYLNLFDVEAIVTTASQYHFLGDGKHALGEVTPHWRTKGRRAWELAIVPHEPAPEAGALTEYRPFPRRWIQDLWTHEYAAAWPHLDANAEAAGEPPFPAPEELLARTYEGNVAFEGDVRADTPGSDAIKRALLDDDPRPLWLLSWGGMNTIVRALMSIAEEHRETAAWDAVRDKVCAKARVMGVMQGVGQDNSWLDHGRELFPDLKLLRAPFPYGGYVDAKAAQPDSVELFRAPWPQTHLIDGNGPLMERYMLYGDGKVYENEPERFQFGKHATLDWGLDGMEPLRFTPGDFMAEGDSMTYIPLIPMGLRGAEEAGFSTLLGPLFEDGAPDPARGAAAGFADLGKPGDRNVNPYLRAYQEDFAARARWCNHGPSDCNHPPRVDLVSGDAPARAGGRVPLRASASDPDGDGLRSRWFVDPAATVYTGSDDLAAWSADAPDAEFEVPRDARRGDRFVLTLAVRDSARTPMTRYAQVALTVR